MKMIEFANGLCLKVFFGLLMVFSGLGIIFGKPFLFATLLACLVLIPLLFALGFIASVYQFYRVKKEER